MCFFIQISFTSSRIPSVSFLTSRYMAALTTQESQKPILSKIKSSFILTIKTYYVFSLTSIKQTYCQNCTAREHVYVYIHVYIYIILQIIFMQHFGHKMYLLKLVTTGQISSQIKLFNRKKIVHTKCNFSHKRRAGACQLMDRLETPEILGSIADWWYLNGERANDQTDRPVPAGRR